ncbi:hypothetical protein ACXR2T_09250 [Leucobacter sp. HY1910]
MSDFTVNSAPTMPAVGRHYPATLAEFRAWFNEDGACLDYLAWLR